jgi:hypothetical protein
VGKKTVSGEIRDAITATAAHRSLPLASLANPAEPAIHTFPTFE